MSSFLKSVWLFVYKNVGQFFSLFVYINVRVVFRWWQSSQFSIVYKNQFFCKTFLYKQKAKHFVSSDVFTYKKPDNSQKAKQFELHLYTKKRTLWVTQLSWNFWNWRRGGPILYAKKMHFVLHFYMQKNALCVTFLYSKSLTLPVTFIY